MSDATNPLSHVVIRRYRPSKDGSWLRHLPEEADPRGPVSDEVSSWVATLDDRAVGIVSWAIEPPAEEGVAKLTRIYVEPEHRRRGVAGKLLHRVFTEIRKSFRKAGLRVSEVQADLPAEADREAAVAFLIQLKFDTEAEPPVKRYA